MVLIRLLRRLHNRAGTARAVTDRQTDTHIDYCNLLRMRRRGLIIHPRGRISWHFPQDNAYYPSEPIKSSVVTTKDQS